MDVMAEQNTDTARLPEAGGGPPPRPASALADPRLHAAAFALVAFLPRLFYLFQAKPWPFFHFPVLDAGMQYRWALAIVKTPLWVGDNSVLAKAPLYSYFLAWNVWLFGEGKGALLSAHLLQFLLGSLTCGLIYLLGRRIFGAAAGALAALLFAFFGPGIFNEGELLDTALTTFLTAALLLALLSTLDRPTTGRWLGTGVLLGLLGITRPNLLLLAPLALIFLLRWTPRPAARAAALALLLGIVVVILPVTARNLYLAGEFIPISSNGGINFFTGNNPKADGYSPIPAGVAWERSWYEWDYLGLLTLNQQDRFFLRQGLRFWRDHPASAAALFVKKCYLFWNAYDIPNNVSFDWAWERAPLLRIMPFGFGIVGTLGLAGLALGARRSREAKVLALCVAVIMLSIVIYFVNGRYRSQLLPALLPFAAFALVALLRAAFVQERRVLAWGAVVLLLGGLFVNSDLYGVRRTRAPGANRDYFYLGESYAAADQPEASKAAYRRAVQVDPADADAWAFMGKVEEHTRDVQAAAEHYRKALAVAPDYAKTAGWLGELALQQGWPLDDPERLLRRALSMQRNSVEGHLALLQIDLRKEDAPRAAEDLQGLARVLSIYVPTDAEFARLQQRVSEIVARARRLGVKIPENLAEGA